MTAVDERLAGRGETTRRLADLITSTRFADLPDNVVEAARCFLADTLAVGVGGRCNATSDKVLAMAQGWGVSPGERLVRILGRPGVALPPLSAAVVNGFQIHCLEWDALHEPSVVIALCTTTTAILSETDGKNIPVEDLLVALVVGVETAVFFGAASTTEPRFFRPSTAGVLGATAALAKLRGLDCAQTMLALGIAYSQAAGTMQAHWEGTDLLALQVGFAARAALTAVDAVGAGIVGPIDVIDGKFGYFSLFETNDTPAAYLDHWAIPWKIIEVAHKPFPAGRASQATLTALMDIGTEHAFGIEDVDQLTVQVPSLIKLLVGRPYSPDMSQAYARLCLEWIAPQMMRHRTIDPTRFTSEHFRKEQAALDAKKVVMVQDDNPDPNALSPQRIELRLRDGRVFHQFVEVPYGSPLRPLDRDAQLAKARTCFAAAQFPRDPKDLFAALDGGANALFSTVTEIGE